MRGLLEFGFGSDISGLITFGSGHPSEIDAASFVRILFLNLSHSKCVIIL